MELFTHKYVSNLDNPCPHCPELNQEERQIINELREIIKSKDGYKLLEEKLHDSKYRNLIQYRDEKDLCNTLLHLASDESLFECMEVLLKHGANPNVQNRKLQLPLHTVVDGGDGCHCRTCNKKNAECVQLLINGNSLINTEDGDGDTPLANSGIMLMPDCAKVLWNNGACLNRNSKSIWKQKESKAVAGTIVTQLIPDEVESWLNDGISVYENETTYLNLNFGVILRATDKEFPQETRFLSYMMTAHRKGREKLLLHPLVQAYLSLKWAAVERIFFLLLSSYMGLVLLYTTYIFTVFLYNCPYDAIEKEDDLSDAAIQNSSVKLVTKAFRKTSHLLSLVNSSKALEDTDTSDEKCTPTPWIYFLSSVMLFFVVCMIINELYESSQGLKKYLKIGLNYGWWVMIITVSINQLPVFTNIHGQWQYPIAAFGIFLAWGMFLTQLARNPRMGIYVEMLGSVIRDLSVFAMTFIALIIGFACGFIVLFRDNPMFEYEYGFLSLVKGLLMMNGETDYETLFDEEENPRASDLDYSIMAHIMFVGFIIVITIVLTNLLLGLAVSDIQQLRETATLSRTERLIQQIHLLETFINKSWIPSGMKDFWTKYYSIQAICESVTYQDDESKNRKDDSLTSKSDDCESGKSSPVISKSKKPSDAFVPEIPDPVFVYRVVNFEKKFPENITEQLKGFLNPPDHPVETKNSNVDPKIEAFKNLDMQHQLLEIFKQLQSLKQDQNP